MSGAYFRVHPSINFSRVGTSEEFYIAPETAAGKVVDIQTGLFGGLPIKAGTEATPIEEADLRDAAQNPRRQAARFRVYAYDAAQTQYPSNDPGREIKVGDSIGGKQVKDILWQVHLANKKANNYQIASANGDEEGIVAYENGKTPPLRNPTIGSDSDPNNPQRLRQLVIDAGPRTLSVVNDGGKQVAFDAKTPASYVDAYGQITPIAGYPTSFPDDQLKMYNPRGPIDTLGSMQIESGTGRLLVVGGFGKASGIYDNNGKPPKLDDAIDNDAWFDDTSDGPVTATIVFTDGSVAQAVHAWVVCTDPGYAPQIRNVVSNWDDIYSTWVEQLNLVPQLFANGSYNTDYKAAFDEHVMPVFHGALLQRWNTNLPSQGINGHNFVASIKPTDDPTAKIPNLKNLIRDPNNKGEFDEGVKMPLALGDAMKSFLALTPTQYFLLMQWYDGKSVPTAPALGGGERLDQAVLENCLGGRYSPGIDLTFIVRDTHLYDTNWQGRVGPFRINMQALDYGNVQPGTSFLQNGYVPLRPQAVEPGDLCKFMALPWHTDYNSCATHEPDPNPAGNNTLYWSWPAQRPVYVYPADLCTFDGQNWSVGGQVFSVRGDGTQTDYPQQQGRYQCYFDFVENWPKVGFVIQGTQMSAPQGGNYGSDKFLEASSLYGEGETQPPWPIANLPGYKAPSDCGPS